MRVACFLLAIVLAACGARQVHAQSLTLSPAVVPLKGSFGQSATQVLTLRNDSDIALDFELEAKDVVVRDGARVFVTAGELPDSIAATAVFSPARIQVAPRSSGTVNVTLTLPASARHRAMVAYFRGTTLVPAGRRQATMSLGTLLTFSVSDRTSVEITPLEVSPPTASTLPRLAVTLSNDGEEPVIPTGTAAILDGGGRLVGKVAFPKRRLLPGERTHVVADYAGDLPAGSYQVVATFDAAGHAVSRDAVLIVR